MTKRFNLGDGGAVDFAPKPGLIALCPLEAKDVLARPLADHWKNWLQ